VRAREREKERRRAKRTHERKTKLKPLPTSLPASTAPNCQAAIYQQRCGCCCGRRRRRRQRSFAVYLCERTPGKEYLCEADRLCACVCVCVSAVLLRSLITITPEFLLLLLFGFSSSAAKSLTSLPASQSLLQLNCNERRAAGGDSSSFPSF